ncbi:MAG: DUF6350 family protein, partial [Bifidobacteriaceae bacterium]|nr:DUF6350 family protein [Bifidobacteriaceae bacterium]
MTFIKKISVGSPLILIVPGIVCVTLGILSSLILPIIFSITTVVVSPPVSNSSGAIILDAAVVAVATVFASLGVPTFFTTITGVTASNPEGIRNITQVNYLPLGLTIFCLLIIYSYSKKHKLMNWTSAFVGALTGAGMIYLISWNALKSGAVGTAKATANYAINNSGNAADAISGNTNPDAAADAASQAATNTANSAATAVQNSDPVFSNISEFISAVGFDFILTFVLLLIPLALGVMKVNGKNDLDLNKTGVRTYIRSSPLILKFPKFIQNSIISSGIYLIAIFVLANIFALIAVYLQKDAFLDVIEDLNAAGFGAALIMIFCLILLPNFALYLSSFFTSNGGFQIGSKNVFDNLQIPETNSLPPFPFFAGIQTPTENSTFNSVYLIVFIVTIIALAGALIWQNSSKLISPKQELLSIGGAFGLSLLMQYFIILAIFLLSS